MQSGKRRASIGVLFWIAFILLILVIFLANRSNIQNVVESTGIVEVIRDRFGRNADPPVEGPHADDPGEAPLSGDPQPGDSAEGGPAETPGPSDDGTPGDSPQERSPRVAIEPEDGPEDAGEPEVVVQVDGPAAREPQIDAPAVDPRRPSTDPARPNKRMAGLYYIKVTDDGRTHPQRVVRAVYYADSPLTETINALIAGPTGEELGLGLLNLIPQGTRLLSAHVDAGVAYLNFNQSFRFNSMGAEGTVAQLQQIIYASTEFSTVTRVQFLIDGERVEYLGGEGIYVGDPLGRDAFS